VFWARLVVKLLVEGMQNYSRGADLERRLNGLPDDLTGLYRLMLDRVN
jgi:hypothetical protein